MMLRHPAGRARLLLGLACGLLLAGGVLVVVLGLPGGEEGRGARDRAVVAASAEGSSGRQAPGDPSAEATATAASGVADPSLTREAADPETGRAADAGADEGADPRTPHVDPSASPPDTGGDERGAAAGGPGGRTETEPAPGTAGAAEAGPDPRDLLARAEHAYAGLSSLRARFRQTIDVPLMDRRREGHGIWYQKGRGHFRMDFLEPPDDEIVADGDHLWLYYPSTNPRQVIKSELGAGGTEAGTADVLARILEEARTSYEGRYRGRERVGDVEAHLVSLRPLDPRSPYRRVRVWIGVRDDLVRRFEITETNETVRTVTLTDLEPGVPIPEGTFRFTPPPDADVFER